jgi:hypothetical protein
LSKPTGWGVHFESGTRICIPPAHTARPKRSPCILAGIGRHVLRGVVVRPGLGSPREAEWRDTVRAAGSTSLEKLLSQNESLVRGESARLATELRAILADLPERAYGLAIGHSPPTECGLYGLTGSLYAPLKECGGFLIVQVKGGRLDVETLAWSPLQG